ETSLRRVNDLLRAGALLLTRRHDRLVSDLGEGRQRTAEIEHVVRPLFGEPDGLRWLLRVASESIRCDTTRDDGNGLWHEPPAREDQYLARARDAEAVVAVVGVCRGRP